MPFGSTTQARIRELSTLIHQYNYSYYCGNDSDESEKYCADETYDALVLELKALENQQLADVAVDPEKNQLYFPQSLDQWPLLFQNHPANQTLVFPEYQNAVPRC